VGEDLPDNPECAATPFHAVYCLQNGETTTKNEGGICTEECDRECIEVNIPECAQKPCDKAAWACPSKDRYIGWFSQYSTDGSYDLGKPPLLEYFPSGSVDTGVLDAFYCKGESKVWVLVGYTIPPKAYLKDGGCIDKPEPDCKFNENLPTRPTCSAKGYFSWRYFVPPNPCSLGDTYIIETALQGIPPHKGEVISYGGTPPGACFQGMGKLCARLDYEDSLKNRYFVDFFCNTANGWLALEQTFYTR
jgi:hypothetical protein